MNTEVVIKATDISKKYDESYALDGIDIEVGKGQIILFSGEPNYRGSALGTNRLWLNAVIYGTGLGSNSEIDL